MPHHQLGGAEHSVVDGRLKNMGETPRFWRMNAFEAYYRDKAYDDRSYEWDGSPRQVSGVPNYSPPGHPSGAAGAGGNDIVDLRQRRPNARYAAARIIVNDFTALLFGENRFPRVLVEGDPDAEDWVGAAFEQAQVPAQAIEARNLGGATGSVVLIAKVINGQYRVEIVNAKLVHDVKWADRDNMVPLSVMLQYKFPSEEVNPETGRTETVMRWFRREISDTADITYTKPLVADGREPVFEPDPELTFQHGLAVCPVVWIQNTRSTAEIDGEPDFCASMETIDRLNEVLSQDHRALYYNHDPHLVLFTKKQGGEVVRGAGKTTVLEPDAKAELLGLPPEPFEVAKGKIEMYRQQALEQSNCVHPEPEKLSGATQSAKAMEFLYAPMLASANVLRTQYGAGIKRLAELFLVIGRKLGVDKVKLPPRYEENPDNADEPPKAINRTPGKAGTLSLQWGPYFHPTFQDLQIAVTTAVDAEVNGILDPETARVWAARHFGVQNPRAVARKATKAQAERKAQDEQDRLTRINDFMDRRNGSARRPGDGAPAQPAQPQRPQRPQGGASSGPTRAPQGSQKPGNPGPRP